MSRSALVRDMRLQGGEQANYDPALYHAPPAAQMTTNVPYYTPQYPPGYALPLPGSYPMQTELGSVPYAPIRLTGDEDDIEEPQNRKSVIPQHGNETTFNINSLLHQNIMENDYFKALYVVKTYHEVLDEIRACVLHVSPWATGTSRVPSSAFCLLLKLLLMKMTYKQMNGILHAKDNVYIRAIGFLYLRYSCPPSDLYKWFEEFLEDETEICPSSDKDIKMTIGEYCIKLLTDMQYYGTTLPRIPVLIERKIKVQLLLLEEKQRRRRNNLKFEEKGFLKPGAHVKAIYSDEENEPAWYDAVIDYKDEESKKYLVTFPEYGNQSAVDLGDIQYTETDKSNEAGKRSRNDSDDDRRASRRRSRSPDSRSNSRRRRSRSRDSRDGNARRRRSSSKDRRRSPSVDRRRSRSRTKSPDNNALNLMERVLQKDREASAAVGRKYGHRPVSYKGSLSLKLDTYTARKKSPERGGSDQRYRRPRSRSPDQRKTDTSSSTATKATSQENLEKMRRLKEAYGDASASNA